MAGYSGTIKFYNSQKGWGFIECEETHDIYGKDIIVLRSSLPGGDCVKGSQVLFDIKEGPQGPQADNVQIIGEDEAGDVGPATFPSWGADGD